MAGASALSEVWSEASPVAASTPGLPGHGVARSEADVPELRCLSSTASSRQGGAYQSECDAEGRSRIPLGTPAASCSSVDLCQIHCRCGRGTDVHTGSIRGSCPESVHATRRCDRQNPPILTGLHTFHARSEGRFRTGSALNRTLNQNGPQIVFARRACRRSNRINLADPSKQWLLRRRTAEPDASQTLSEIRKSPPQSSIGCSILRSWSRIVSHPSDIVGADSVNCGPIV